MFIDDIDILILAIQQVAEAYLDFDNLPNAFFAYREMVRADFVIFIILSKVKLCKRTEKYKKQIEGLLGLFSCALRMRDYKFCITLLKKAIQYAWYFNDVDSEIVIYDKFGLVFFNLKDMQKANLYHLR